MNEQDSFESAVASAQIEYDQLIWAGDMCGAEAARVAAIYLLEQLPF